MGYIKEYDKTLIPNGFDKINQLLGDGKIITTHSYRDFKISDFQGEKYYSLTIDTDDDPPTYAAFLYVTYLNDDDINDIVSVELDVFPFMMIVFPSKVDFRAQKYLNADNTLEHEISHLKCLKNHFDLNPSFIKRGKEFALCNLRQRGNVTDEDIKRCVEYEVEKLFLIEPKAMKKDFELGENVIPIPFLFTLVEYKCNSHEEYVQMKIHGYLDDVKAGIRKLEGNKPHHSSVINEVFDSSLRNFGKTVFGHDADIAYKNLDNNWLDNVMTRVLLQQ